MKYDQNYVERVACQLTANASSSSWGIRAAGAGQRMLNISFVKTVKLLFEEHVAVERLA